MKKTIRTKDADILFGPIAVAGFILIYDLISIKIRKRTISASIRHLSNKGYGPEISGAIAGCLIFHLFFRND
jgi:hypothetical protein